MAKSRPARLVDVAQLAGVTVSTASRALSRPELVRPETRARVVEAAEKLCYVPDRAARTLITGRAGVIAFLVPDLTHPHFALVARAAQSAATDRGYDLATVDTLGDPEREHAMVEALSRWVDGLVICSPHRTHRPSPNGGAPIVFVNRKVRGSHSVVVDQQGVVDAQLRHLLELGHEHIVCCAGPKWAWTSENRTRRAQRLATRHDIRITSPTYPDFESGAAFADALDDDVTAIAAFNDHQALGVLSRLLERGARVPDDVSVVGTEDIPVARFVHPALTTVHIPTGALGRAAVSLLLDHLGDDGPVIHETLSGHLVVRGSTGPPPTSGGRAA